MSDGAASPVTLEVLSTKLDYIAADIGEIRQQLKQQNDRLRTNEADINRAKGGLWIVKLLVGGSGFIGLAGLALGIINAMVK